VLVTAKSYWERKHQHGKAPRQEGGSYNGSVASVGPRSIHVGVDVEAIRPASSSGRTIGACLTLFDRRTHSPLRNRERLSSKSSSNDRSGRKTQKGGSESNEGLHA
jgi:hypothetical protein